MSLLSAEEIARKYAGKVVKANVIKSSPVSDAAGGSVTSFDARVIGYKKWTAKDPYSYVAVEVLAPNQTKFTIADLQSGYTYTHKTDSKAYGKKLFPEELTLPAVSNAPVHKVGKVISEWPHKCPKCQSPAFISNCLVDCSKKDCANKFKTRDAKSLFLPVEMREIGWDREPGKHRPEVDDDGFLICPTCKSESISAQAYGGKWKTTKPYVLLTNCDRGHEWSVSVEKGDRAWGINHTDVLVFNGSGFTKVKQ